MSTTVSTSKPIKLDQLSTEVGTDQLSMHREGATKVIVCHDPEITQEELDVAVEAHVAIDTEGNRKTLEEQAASAIFGNKAFLAMQGAPTQAQVLAQVKDLTRQMNSLIRLTLGQLDGTE